MVKEMNIKYLSIFLALFAVSFSYANWGDGLEIGVQNDPNEVTTTEMDWGHNRKLLGISNFQRLLSEAEVRPT